MTIAEVAIPADERIRGSVVLLMGVRRITQLELAAAIGLKRQVMGNRVAGRTRFTTDEAEVIARFFDVPLEVLYAGPSACLRFLSDAAENSPNPGLNASFADTFTRVAA